MLASGDERLSSSLCQFISNCDGSRRKKGCGSRTSSTPFRGNARSDQPRALSIKTLYLDAANVIHSRREHCSTWPGRDCCVGSSPSAFPLQIRGRTSTTSPSSLPCKWSRPDTTRYVCLAFIFYPCAWARPNLFTRPPDEGIADASCKCACPQRTHQITTGSHLLCSGHACFNNLKNVGIRWSAGCDRAHDPCRFKPAASPACSESCFITICLTKS